MMRFAFWQTGKEYALQPLEPDDATALSHLHREDFARPWSEDEFAALIGDDTVIGFAARQTGHGREPPAGFVLARRAAGEGEILTIAVSRAHRRRGIGWLLMDAVLRQLHAERAEALFLEVDETNTPAIALYRRLGFETVGRRPNYYPAASGGASGALVMRRDLR
jgi:ribosomal-protein-alanine N-acetyltransferase